MLQEHSEMGSLPLAALVESSLAMGMDAFSLHPL